MNVNSKTSLSIFKYKYGLILLALYGLYASITDFYYVEEMFSCTSGLNLCKNISFPELTSSAFTIYFVHSLKIFSFSSLLFSRYTKTSLFFCFITSLYFVFLNPYVYSPDIPYINFLLFTLLFTSSNKKLFFQDIFYPFMLVIYFSYSFSGYYKLLTPNWINGHFLSIFLSSNHLAQPWVDNINFNDTMLYYMTFFVLFSEALAGLALINRYIRTAMWFSLTSVHFGLVFIANLSQVSLAMLVIHFFLLDEFTWSIINKIYYHKRG